MRDRVQKVADVIEGSEIRKADHPVGKLFLDRSSPRAIEQKVVGEKSSSHHFFYINIRAMQNTDIPASLPGYDTVKQWFGVWPDFHDAEVIGLTLDRRGESLLPESV